MRGMPGANGVSMSDAIPDIAAQRPAYIEAQLKAFKDGTLSAGHDKPHRFYE